MKEVVKRIIAQGTRLWSSRSSRTRVQGEDTRRLPSLVKAMKSLVPKSVMREVVASSHDRRQWGVLAAAWVGVSEREFVNAAARELHMPYQDAVAVPDLTCFGSKARSMLTALRRVGAIAVLQDCRVVGFVATDPAEVRGLEMYDGTHAISMAPWTEIAKALDMAERLIAESEANGLRDEIARQRELCEKVLKILITEATRHGAAALEIVTAEGKSRYQFATVEGKIAVGTIQQGALESLLRYLNDREGGVFQLATVGNVIVRTLGNASNLRLSWGASQAHVGIPWSSPQTAEPDRHSEVSSNATTRIATSDSTDEEERSGEKVPVLVVDDNPMFCRVVERLLKRENCDVSFEDSGRAALERLANLTNYLPRVIICDLHMPQMSGKELVQKLKEDGRLRSIPIIMLTSDEGVDVELVALEIGADALVSKSKDPRVLCAQVMRLAKQRALQEAA